MTDYQWEHQNQNQIPTKNINNWNSEFGYQILTRHNNQIANKIRFSLLTDNKNLEVYIIGTFNNWEKNSQELQDYKLNFDTFTRISEVILTNIKHKDEYKYLVIDKLHNKTKIIEDPASTYFTDFGNSIFWDFEDPSTYKQKYGLINNFNRSVKILQTDLPGLIVHYNDKKTKQKGSDLNQKEYYKFITESGVIEKIKELGFNTIQFLPFAQSIDGDNWKYRYLVPFQYAIQKNWGNPDEFSQMIDEFHKHDIAVIGDFVVGHLPDRDYKVFGMDGKNHGLQTWKKKNGEFLYLKEETYWGTRRLDFDSPHIRKFFISSCLHFLKYYKIDGFRIDNVDGIIRHGKNGDKEERENGRTFLRELNSEIYNYNPQAMINFEAHYFADGNAKLLVSKINSNLKALGATAYNSSRLTHYFHSEYMLKTVKEITVWKFKYINEEKEWGKSNSTITDFHNHDAAAGIMEQRCTGSYAFDSMTHNSIGNQTHAIGKIKVMEAIISFWGESRTLDLLQTILLQEGTFEHDSSIHWDLEKTNKSSRGMINFKKEINKIMDYPAFWVINSKNRDILNVDDKNKIIVIERKSNTDNFLIIINFGNFILNDYKIGVKENKDYNLILNSDLKEFAGYGYSNTQNEKFRINKSNSFELFDKEINLKIIAPYNILIFKQEK
jgi:1,4-alpha-glucan branching enzyme